jgi:hypothetical protein
MMLESGRIRLVRPSTVIITYFHWMSGKTLENFIHKDRRRNVGCIHTAVYYRGFIPKGDRVLSYNIIVVPNPH